MATALYTATAVDADDKAIEDSWYTSYHSQNTKLKQ